MKTWRDVYKLPLKLSEYGSHVYDKWSNFVFQFEPKFDAKGNYAEGYKELEDKVLRCINGEQIERKTKNIAIHKEGRIFIGGVHLITIRGWGNLTGTGAKNLSAEEAANIQDTFAEFIVERLNKDL